MKRINKLNLGTFSSLSILDDREKRAIVGGSDEVLYTCKFSYDENKQLLCSGTCPDGGPSGHYYCVEGFSPIQHSCGCVFYSD